mgnify:CR=1 FL=1
MSIFNNYDKPGKGVEKNKPKKLPIVIFFETAVRKYWKFIQSGALFTLFSIPWLIFLYIGSYFILYIKKFLPYIDKMLCHFILLYITLTPLYKRENETIHSPQKALYISHIIIIVSPIT